MQRTHWIRRAAKPAASCWLSCRNFNCRSHRIVTCADDADPVADAADAIDLEGREAGGTRAAGRLAAVHVVAAEEAASGAFDIADVVLPLPGSRIRYPEHDAAQV